MFSYHDIICPPDVVQEIFPNISRPLKRRKDAQDILRWHKAVSITSEVIDTVDLFEALGWSLDVFDKVQARGCEIHKDLNEPFDASFLGQYDVVYDGVLSQVFCAGQCMKSACELLMLGGYLISVSMANGPNHGWYSISPTFYWDFLQQNGFRFNRHRIVQDIATQAIEIPFHPTKGHALPPRCVHAVLAKRVEMKPVCWPVQSKFIRHPDSLLAPDCRP